MKLKYYMRGIGIGMVFSAVLFAVNDKEMTDEQIKERARYLGMVEAENNNNEIGDIPLGTPTPKSEISPSPKPSEKISVTPDAKPSIEASVTPNIELSTGASITPEITSEVTPSIPAASDITSLTVTPVQTDGKIIVVIKEGMHSEDVAALFYRAGIIEDADDFNKYLQDNNFDETIRYGTFGFKKGTSYKDIALRITEVY